MTLTSIAAPPNKWDSPQAVFEEVYKHECHVSSLIDKLAELAEAEKDHASAVFLQWFITEQVEEVCEKCCSWCGSKCGAFCY